MGVFALLSAAEARAENHFYDHKNPGLIIQNEIVVHTSNNGTYFSLLGNGFGYGGIQQSSTGKRNYIYSFWDQNREKTMLLAYAPDLVVNRIGRFGDNINLEGTGFQLLFDAPWKNNAVIRMAYRATPGTDPNYLRVSGFYREGDAAWRYVGTFRLRTNKALFTGTYGFVENFSGQAGPRKASFRNHWQYDANGDWEESLSARVLPQGEAVVTPEPGGVLVQFKAPTQADWERIHWSTAPGNRMIPIPFQLDCGRNSVVRIDGDSQGLAHLVDKIGSFEVDGYVSGGMAHLAMETVTTSGVANAAPAAVYRSARTGAEFSYVLGGLTPSTDHVLRLHFAELEASSVGQRMIDVSVNDASAVTGLDVFALAGARKAWVRTIGARTDERGRVTLRFSAAAGSTLPASVNGIELTEGLVAQPVPTTDAGAPPLDAGTSTTDDAGTSPPDAEPPARDAGPPPTAAGTSPPAAGASPRDGLGARAGSRASVAGRGSLDKPHETHTGCSVSAVRPGLSSAWVFVLLAGLWRIGSRRLRVSGAGRSQPRAGREDETNT